MIAGEDVSPLDFDPSEENPLEGVAAQGDACPCPPGEVKRILGIQIDGFFQLGEHFEHLLVKAQVRRGILKRVKQFLGPGGWTA